MKDYTPQIIDMMDEAHFGRRAVAISGFISREVEAAEARGEKRLLGLIKGAEWIRRDGRTYLCVRVADGADLSCPALREDAIRALIDGEGEVIDGSTQS